MTKIINLYSGPGAGKSTTAAMVFSLMKQHGVNCELVTEYAKDMVWWGAENKLKNEIYVFAKQQSRIERLLGKVDYVITDSPLLLAVIYGDLYKGSVSPEFRALVHSEVERMDNINIFLNRVKKYNPVGRMQTEEEAKGLDKVIKSCLNDLNYEYTEQIADKDVAYRIVDSLNL